MFDRSARPALIVACVTLVLCGVGFRAAVISLNAVLLKKPVELRHELTTLPGAFGPWEQIGEEPVLDAASLEELGTDKYLTRHYAIDGNTRGRHLTLHLTYYTGVIDAVPHVPDRCMVAAGMMKEHQPRNIPLDINRRRWKTDDGAPNGATGTPYMTQFVYDKVTGRSQDVRMPIGDELALRTTAFRHPERPGLRVFAGYFFICNGRIATTPEEVRLRAFNVSEEYAYYIKVQFTMALAGDDGEQQFITHVSEFTEALLPRLMRCLPDWAELERASDQSRPGASAPAAS